MIGVGVTVGVAVGAGVYGAGVAVGRSVAATVKARVGVATAVGGMRVITCPQALTSSSGSSAAMSKIRFGNAGCGSRKIVEPRTRFKSDYSIGR
jgi:hypothetical protein